MDASLSPVKSPPKEHGYKFKQYQQSYIDEEKKRGCRMGVGEFLNRNDNERKLKR